MKTFNQFIAVALIMGLLFTSCQKEQEEQLTDEQETEQMIISSEDHATADNLYQDVEDRVDEAIQTRGNGMTCPTVTADPNWQTYPRTVTIDFGDGCEGVDGRTRKGQIVVEVTDNILNVDAMRRATLVGFSVDGIQIEGSRTWKNVGYDAEGNITLSRRVTNAKITYLDGDVAEWESDGLLTQTAGGATPFNFFDNVFEITGTASGINRHGHAFTVTIDEALVKDKVCPWLVSGILSLTVDNVEVSLDYGNGNCDRKAILKLPNGTEHEIFI